MGYKAFLFDMDGTLIDNMGVHSQVWSEFLAGHGVPITPAEFYAQAAGRTNAEILRQLIGPHLEDDQVEVMSTQKEELYRWRYLPIMRAMDGLADFLHAAHAAGIFMAVASSAGHENISFHLSGLGLSDYFQAVVGAEDVLHGKPHPDLFLAAAKRLGVLPANCLVFEDTPTGLEAARRAGMQAVALTTSYPAEILSQNPTVLRVEPDFSSISPQNFLS
jgi:beta-phosphoglucomutase family hydrolase